MALCASILVILLSLERDPCMLDAAPAMFNIKTSSKSLSP
jgi:hypothetical protein